ncbi:MAG: hypothetical protein KatS3mg131_2107 [Candidatus Tectimicrobiota bacterium]|nr:MAG: hypothetical protein KatS3mg131_2107 [Candidatus Tectomicrobia bacterium]
MGDGFSSKWGTGNGFFNGDYNGRLLLIARSAFPLARGLTLHLVGAYDRAAAANVNGDHVRGFELDVWAQWDILPKLWLRCWRRLLLYRRLVAQQPRRLADGARAPGWPIRTTSGSLARACSMTLANAPHLLGFLACLAAALAGCRSISALRPPAYGPTHPGGYTVQVTPLRLTVSPPQRPRLTVRVTDAAGRPAEGVAVAFFPSEGSVTPATTRTHQGVATATFSPASGSDHPRTATVRVQVEDVTVVVFLDLVPAVFGR